MRQKLGDQRKGLALEVYSEPSCGIRLIKHFDPVATRPRVTFSNSSIQGRGVFALRSFRAGEEIEACHAVLIPWEQISHDSVLSSYVFDWDEHNAALVLGCGSIYNHSGSPSAHVVMDYDEQTAHFVASRSIRGGEEITIDYGDEYPRTWEYQDDSDATR